MGNRRKSEVVMIEAYAFLAAFAVQILAASILYPAALIKYVRGWARNFGSNRFAQLYPGVDYSRWVARFVTGYRATNIVIAVLGLLLLGWLFTRIQQPGWAGEVTGPAVMYFILQMSPLALFASYAVVRYHKMLVQPSQESKRKATLQRRGLFDFVSPSVVYLAVASYFLFVAYGIWLDLYVYDNSSLSKHCLKAIVSVTLVYALNAFVIYKYLYGRKNPLVNHEGRVHTISVTVKSGVYGSIAIAWFISIFGTLGQPGLQEWRPFALIIFFVATTLLTLMGLTAPPRKAEADGVGSSSEVPS
jgi:NhaP-type Na+/H+ or K+/H+ antiporter